MRTALVVMLGLAIALPGAGLPALAAAIDQSWSFVDEQSAAESPGGRQARASIYRGDHLVAVRCHDDHAERWESLLVGATWFGHPKARLTFTLSVDGRPPIELDFRRETDYRFAASDPPKALLQAMMDGSSLTIGGADFVGDPVVVPLSGSRDALTKAFALCGYDPIGD